MSSDVKCRNLKAINGKTDRRIGRCAQLDKFKSDAHRRLYDKQRWCWGEKVALGSDHTDAPLTDRHVCVCVSVWVGGSAAPWQAVPLFLSLSQCAGQSATGSELWSPVANWEQAERTSTSSINYQHDEYAINTSSGMQGDGRINLTRPINHQIWAKCKYQCDYEIWMNEQT